MDTLITTANSAQRGGDDNVQNIDLIGNRHLVNSARTVGIKHFIFVSSAKADDKSQSPYLQAKKKTENHLIQSGMDYTIVAPEPIMEAWFNTSVIPALKANRPVALIGEGNRHHSFISLTTSPRSSPPAWGTRTTEHVPAAGRPEGVRLERDDGYVRVTDR